MTRYRVIAALTVLALCVFARSARAQSVQEIFERANNAYFHGDFDGAIAGYERLVGAGVQDPDVYFNLAVAHARAGALGRAVLYFERSAWLRPGDELTVRELAAARTVLGRRRAERHGEATLKSRPPLVEAILQPISVETLTWSLLALDVLFFTVLIARRAGKHEPARLALAILLPLLGLGTVLSAFGLAYRIDLFETGSAAVVLREGAELREGPDASAALRASADEGQSARVLERSGRFSRVQLSGGATGWMKQNDLGTIRPN